MGYQKITRGPNKGENSDRPITRKNLYGKNRGLTYPISQPNLPEQVCPTCETLDKP